MNEFIIEMIYLLSAVGFFICLKMLSSPKTARLGNFIGSVAMGGAVIATLTANQAAHLMPVLLCMGSGALVGIFSAKRVEMTAMPQMVAIFNGLGGLASVMVAMAEIYRFLHTQTSASFIFSFTTWFSVVVGAVTFTGSIVAYLKLQELISTRALLLKGQRLLSGALFVVILLSLGLLIKNPASIFGFGVLSFVAALLGVLLVLPIGGADMPVVISLLNSYSGLAALAAGFVVHSNILIISGALVGASGVILTRLMCQAMNRSLMNVVFGAFGNALTAASLAEEKPLKEFQPLDAAMLLSQAAKVVIVPGYGLAVSQAQRTLRELSDALKALGVEVSYAIHPVAGRMPGHMNVLLAEADIPYDELFSLEEINGDFESSDVVVIIGANDVVNPSAREDKTSPLYGMPILNADKAKAVIVMKRGRGRGFAGVENPLFTLEQTGLVFGDAKQSLLKVIAALKEV
ncbi:MAG: NAD(P)(+) transhydrogenase (Re/Si-specific) subunit beta [Myxococcales bacterium]|nr:NAD(P)(+) transhydrogenase (Re/Si-specific) subunit beta [Myxococcales bacterium]USN50394.1 MAG: NAD(P)(+) transhydrogenase (Re/Si-specific) subunit beta [Myxococcales bacterium]